MIIGLILLGIFCIFMCIIKDDDTIGAMYTMCGIALLAVPVIGSFCSIANNADDLATLRKYDGVIAVQEKRIESLQKILGKNIPVSTTQGNWASADTPNSSLIESYGDAVNSIANAESHKAYAAVNIESRKDGMFWFVVSIYGEK